MKINLTKEEYRSIAYALNELIIDRNTLLFPDDRRKEILTGHITNLEAVLAKYKKEQPQKK